MQLLTFTMPRDFTLIQWGDTHEGTQFQVKHGIEEVIDTIIREKNCYSFHVGDWAESRTIDHPYYDNSTARTGSNTPLAQLMVVRDKFKPLSDKKDRYGNSKLLWINKGNHDRSVDNFGGLTEHLCSELGIAYGKWSTRATFIDPKGKQMFKGYWTHGFEGVHTLTSQAQDPKLQKAHAEMKIKKMLYPMAGDCIIMGMGHYHRLVINEPSRELYLTDDTEKIYQNYTSPPNEGFIHQDLRWYCCSGAFYRQFLPGHDSYAERRGLRPTELGYIKIHVVDGEIKRVEPVVIK